MRLDAVLVLIVVVEPAPHNSFLTLNIATTALQWQRGGAEDEYLLCHDLSEVRENILVRTYTSIAQRARRYRLTMRRKLNVMT